MEFTKNMMFNDETLRRIEESKLEDEKTTLLRAILEIKFIPENGFIEQEL